MVTVPSGFKQFVILLDVSTEITGNGLTDIDKVAVVAH